MLLIPTAVLLAAVGYYLWSQPRRPDPVPAFDEFIAFLSGREWGSIYDRTPPGEYRQLGVSRETFIKFMTKVSGDMYGSTAPTSIQRVGKDVLGDEVWILTYASQTGRDSQVMIRLYLGPDGWKVATNDLALGLSRTKYDRREALRQVADKMEAVGMAKLPHYQTMSYTRPDLMRQSSRDEIESHWLRGKW